MSAYLDNSATTKPEEAVAKKVYQMLTEHFGNPSSFHKEGLNANAEVRRAREIIAKTTDFVDGYYFSFPFNRVHMLKKIIGKNNQ